VLFRSSEHNLELAPLNTQTHQRLAQILPSAASLTNPIDVAGGTDSNPAIFADCARALLADESVDGLLITGLYGGYGVRFSHSLAAIELETTTRIAALSREYGKPIVVHSLYSTLHADLRPLPLTRLRQAGIPVHESLEQAVRCLQALASFSEVSGQNQALPAPQSGQTETCVDDLIKICRR